MHNQCSHYVFPNENNTVGSPPRCNQSARYKFNYIYGSQAGGGAREGATLLCTNHFLGQFAENPDGRVSGNIHPAPWEQL